MHRSAIVAIYMIIKMYVLGRHDADYTYRLVIQNAVIREISSKSHAQFESYPQYHIWKYLSAKISIGYESLAYLRRTINFIMKII